MQYSLSVTKTYGNKDQLYKLNHCQLRISYCLLQYILPMEIN